MVLWFGVFDIGDVFERASAFRFELLGYGCTVRTFREIEFKSKRTEQNTLYKMREVHGWDRLQWLEIWFTIQTSSLLLIQLFG
jgi:hypothetical protein